MPHTSIYNLDQFTVEVQAIAQTYLNAIGAGFEAFEAAQQEFYANLEALQVDDEILFLLEQELGI